MTKLVAVSKTRHGHKSWQRSDSYRFAASRHMAPIMVAEVFRAALSMPLAFVRSEQKYLLVGLLSLSAGQNFFVASDGKWVGGHIPLVFRAYPFRLANTADRRGMVLSVDEESGLISEDKGEGEPFFDDDGKMSRPLREVAKFLDTVEKSRKVAEIAANALDEAGVIVPWPMKIGEKQAEGLYRIDQAKLQQVEDEIFLNLRKTGALIVAYGQLMSMGNIGFLQRLAVLREKISSSQQPKGQAPNDEEFIRLDG